MLYALKVRALLVSDAIHAIFNLAADTSGLSGRCDFIDVTIM